MSLESNLVNVRMSIPPSPVIPLPSVDTGENFPCELKETYLRMDMAILFVITKNRDRTLHPQEKEHMAGDTLMYCCAQAMPSRGRMNELQLNTFMLVTHTCKLFSDQEKLQKIHTLKIYTH